MKGRGKSRKTVALSFLRSERSYYGLENTFSFFKKPFIILDKYNNVEIRVCRESALAFDGMPAPQLSLPTNF